MSIEFIKSQQAVILRSTEPPYLEWALDFSLPAYQQRLNQRSRKTDQLAKAIGLDKQKDLKVLDMTAGLGKDAYWLAHCGARVTLAERHAGLAAALTCAVGLLAENMALSEVGKRMQVVHADALHYLQESNETFDVAYYDPMFPERKKSALVKKDMQILQMLHTDDTSTETIIELVLTKAKKLVVKRPAHAAFLEEKTPHHQILGDAVRYDVYV